MKYHKYKVVYYETTEHKQVFEHETEVEAPNLSIAVTIAQQLSPRSYSSTIELISVGRVFETEDGEEGSEMDF